MVIEELLAQHSCPCISTNYTSQSHAWHVNREIEFLRGILSYRCPDRLMIQIRKVQNFACPQESNISSDGRLYRMALIKEHDVSAFSEL